MKKKFLIGILGRYGDCLFATTIAKQIKNDFPHSHITWAIATNFKSVLDQNPYIDDVWEIPISNGDYYGEGWELFEKEALSRKTQGDFDEIIFSQIMPNNWEEFTGTIRKTILNTYQNPITVEVSPVIRLTKDEVNNVVKFADEYKLQTYKNVILFECNPSSAQSNVDIDFALTTAESFCQNNQDTCFILSSPNIFTTSSKHIFDASKLSFRENAELTKYCTLLIGCSSGLTWLTTSDWAKKLPMVQVLGVKQSIFAGIAFDHRLWGLDDSNIIEICDSNRGVLLDILSLIFTKSFANAKDKYHSNIAPKLMKAQWHIFDKSRNPYKLFQSIQINYQHYSLSQRRLFILYCCLRHPFTMLKYYLQVDN